jgi:hypothetical protein
LRARARAARPILSNTNTAAAGGTILFARQRSRIATTIGSPRSVAHAASAQVRRHERQSANPKLRGLKAL